VVARLATGLRAAGHEVSVVSTAPRARAGWDAVDGVRVLRLDPANIYWAGEAPRRATILKPLWHLLDLWNPATYQRLRAFLVAEKPDVVHTHNLGGLSAAAWSATAAAGLPLIHTLHDHSLTCVRAVRMTRRGRLCERQCTPCAVRSRWLQHLSRAVDAVVAPGRFVLERHLELGFFPGAQTAIVPWGAPPVHAADAPPRREERPVRFLFIGSLQPHKGVGDRARGVSPDAGHPRHTGHRRSRCDGRFLSGRSRPGSTDPVPRVRHRAGKGSAPWFGRRPALPLALLGGRRARDAGSIRPRHARDSLPKGGDSRLCRRRSDGRAGGSRRCRRACSPDRAVGRQPRLNRGDARGMPLIRCPLHLGPDSRSAARGL
jgi:hypothetical protein